MPHLSESVPGHCWEGFGLTLTVTKSDELRANVRLAGDLDVASARLLAAALEHELAAGRRYLRLDLSGLSFLDTAGVTALADMHWAFLGRRGTIIIVGIRPRARRLLALTGMDEVLLVAADLARPVAPVA